MAGFFTIADLILTLMVTYEATQLVEYTALARRYPDLEDASGRSSHARRSG